MALNDMIALRVGRRGFSLVELLMVMAVSATLLAVGTPVLRSALAEQRLRAGSTDVGNALSEARREAFRTSTTARVEVDPADGRISVFATDTTLAPPAEVERKRYYLPAGIQFMAPVREDARLYTVAAALEALLVDAWGGPLLAQAPAR